MHTFKPYFYEEESLSSVNTSENNLNLFAVIPGDMYRIFVPTRYESFIIDFSMILAPFCFSIIISTVS